MTSPHAGSALRRGVAPTHRTSPEGTSTMLPLNIDHVTKHYGKDVVVDDLTFTVAPGRVTCRPLPWPLTRQPSGSGREGACPCVSRRC